MRLAYVDPNFLVMRATKSDREMLVEYWIAYLEQQHGVKL